MRPVPFRAPSRWLRPSDSWPGHAAAARIPPSGGEGTVTIAGEEANDHGRQDVAGEGEVELDDFYFEPTVLVGEPGQTLTVNLFNEGDASHTFTIEDQGIDEVLEPGDEGITAQVMFPDGQDVLFICRFHAAQGMRGGLSVTVEAQEGSGGGQEGDGGGRGPYGME